MSAAEIATIVSPILTLILTAFGWYFVFNDSNKKSIRAETHNILNQIIIITMKLNNRAATKLIEEQHETGKHKAWVASVNVDLAALRALSVLLLKISGNKKSVPDDFFYSIRKNFTLDAEKYSTYNLDERLHKVSLQNTETSKALTKIYELFPA